MLRYKHTFFVTALMSLFCIAMLSCEKKQMLTSGGELRFSADTLLFDTVFTSLGSATYKIKIYNPQNQPVTISSVRLEKGDKSPFKLNVNGIPGNNVADQELAANDSLYVFSIVHIDPTAANTPFVVQDRLIATLNGREFSVPVIAYGQNAHYIFDSLIETDQVWENDKPYVIINNAWVNEGSTLTIKPGCRIYAHANSRLFIDGRLIAEGTKSDSIIFQSDRIDRSYFSYLDLPGEWGGIYFTKNSTGNRMKWTIVKNGGNSTEILGNIVQPAAIEVDYNKNPGTTDQLQMDNCIIQNSIGFGMLCFGAGVRMRNCMINTCGANTFLAYEGGDYEMDNCTIVTYGTSFVSHTSNPVFVMLNYRDTSSDGSKFIPANLNARIRNCIIYGSLSDEVIFQSKGSGVFNVFFQNCLVRSSKGIEAGFQENCLFNQDPKFKDYGKWDYRLGDGSPAIGKGIDLSPSTDLDGNARSSPFNIGAY